VYNTFDWGVRVTTDKEVVTGTVAVTVAFSGTGSVVHPATNTLPARIIKRDTIAVTDAFFRKGQTGSVILTRDNLIGSANSF
jgi:hypothetical protein